MKLVDSARMARIDRETQERFGIPGIVLMENAGIKTFDRFLQIYSTVSPNSDLWVFLAGKGNNGGDTLVMARQAHADGRKTAVIVANEDGGELTTIHLNALDSLGVRIIRWDSQSDEAREAIATATVIFDGLFGTGITPPMRGNGEVIVGYVNSSD